MKKTKENKETKAMNVEEVVANNREVSEIANTDVSNETVQSATSNNSDMEMVTGVESAPIHSSEHQMDGKEMFTGMVTFDYNNVPITDIVNSIILDAINKGASDIHFDPFDEGIKIRIRIDGMLNDYSIVPLYVKKNMITRIKIISGMNITESRTPQDGAIRTELQNKTIDLRVSCLPTNLGEKIVIRIMDYSMSAAGIEGLDFSEENIEKVKKMLDLPNGIILVTGATGSGKSTTVYSMLQRLNVEGTNIITVEDPIEMNIGGINQVQAVQEIGLDFATVLRSILRQDPDVIMIGEIRDEETAKIAVRASITGHLVLSTIHTNNSLNTIERLTDMDVERYLLGSALSGIISQKLSRRLCDKCKRLRKTSDYEKEMFKKVLDKDIEEIYEPVGCNECSRGYRGRIAIQEVLLLNQGIKDAIIRGANKNILRNLVYGNNGTVTMLQDGLEKVLQGKTSFEEILKLIDLDDDLGSGTELGLNDQMDAANLYNGYNPNMTYNPNMQNMAYPAQPVATGPININLTPELLAGLQVPQVVKPIIVSEEDLEDDDELDIETQKSIFSKLKKKKKKKLKEKVEDIVEDIEEETPIEEEVLEENEKIEETIEENNEEVLEDTLTENMQENEETPDEVIEATPIEEEKEEVKEEPKKEKKKNKKKNEEKKTEIENNQQTNEQEVKLIETNQTEIQEEIANQEIEINNDELENIEVETLDDEENIEEISLDDEIDEIELSTLPEEEIDNKEIVDTSIVPEINEEEFSGVINLDNVTTRPIEISELEELDDSAFEDLDALLNDITDSSLENIDVYDKKFDDLSEEEIDKTLNEIDNEDDDIEVIDEADDNNKIDDEIIELDLDDEEEIEDNNKYQAVDDSIIDSLLDGFED